MSVQAIAWVLEHSRSTNTVRCVLVSIANHMNGDGSGWVYVDRICREANCSIKSYHRAIRWAIDNGELERVEHAGGGERTHVRHRPNFYRFVAMDDGRGGQIVEEGGGQFVQEGGGQVDDLNERAVSTAVSTVREKTVADDVFDLWVQVTGRDPLRTKFTPDRRRKVQQRLAEGFDFDELMDAVRGVTLSAFHMGDNAQNQRYDDLRIVMRDGAQVEKFRDLWRNPPQQRRPRSFSTIAAAVGRMEGGNELASGG